MPRGIGLAAPWFPVNVWAVLDVLTDVDRTHCLSGHGVVAMLNEAAGAAAGAAPARVLSCGARHGSGRCGRAHRVSP
ncbi:MAG: hypothetical protein OXG82_15135 [Gammaproteobacteria bacterium]|nr:hypothetical protein [Gammaproteobacteria bacterium]